jgi:hypothetical protein
MGLVLHLSLCFVVIKSLIINPLGNSFHLSWHFPMQRNHPKMISSTIALS